MARTKARSCTGKKQESKREAWNHYWALKRKGAARIHVYKCKFCLGFHVGHMGKPRKRR